jgi:acetylglutamate kinase
LTEHGIPWGSVSQRQRAWIDSARNAVGTGASSIVDFAQTPLAERFGALSELLVGLGTRKLVVLRSHGGLGPRGPGRISLTKAHHLITSESGISVINLRADLAPLTAGSYLDASESALLGHVNQLHQASPQLLTNIASPLNLLRELFTIRGAGTLVKTGSSILRLAGFDEVDFAQLRDLLQATFEKSLTTEFAERPTLNVYLEASYRGVAILQPGEHGAFLTKFAVGKEAQGEGIGRDLWEAMLRDHPSIYWRARTENPISEWYQSECDGMHRDGEWRVYWRGIPPEQIADTIHDALERPIDLVTTQ